MLLSASIARLWALLYDHISTHSTLECTSILYTLPLTSVLMVWTQPAFLLVKRGGEVSFDRPKDYAGDHGTCMENTYGSCRMKENWFRTSVESMGASIKDREYSPAV